MLRVLVDGAQVGKSASLGGLGRADWTLSLGGFDGDIDQVRLSHIARPALAAPPPVAARPAYRELIGTRASATLTANVGPGATVTWSKVSGPSPVVFENRSAPSTEAQFCAPGKYVLAATASREGASASDYAVVRVWPATGRDMPYKTLFVGNSFSFYNGTVGYRYWQFAKAAGELVGDRYAGNGFASMLTAPGRGLRYHWYEPNSNDECAACADHVLPAPPTVELSDFVGAYAQDVIRNGRFDAVFVQGHSEEAFTDARNFARFGNKFDRLIKRSGARTVLFQTWAYPASPASAANEEVTLGNYERLASETGAAVSRVGRAFQDARRSGAGYAAWPRGLLFSDAKHPSSFGTYLMGAMHYAVVYGNDSGRAGGGKPLPSLALFPGVNDIPTPAISSDTARADRMRELAAKFAWP